MEIGEEEQVFQYQGAADSAVVYHRLDVQAWWA